MRIAFAGRIAQHAQLADRGFLAGGADQGAVRFGDAADTSPRTQVVFVTAYDQYAIDAFDNGAVDYLLKPVTRERLDATVQRLQVRAAGAHPDAATLAALIRQPDANPLPDKTPLSWITVSHGTDPRPTPGQKV